MLLRVVAMTNPARADLPWRPCSEICEPSWKVKLDLSSKTRTTLEPVSCELSTAFSVAVDEIVLAGQQLDRPPFARGEVAAVDARRQHVDAEVEDQVERIAEQPLGLICIEANGSAIAGAPTCGAGEMGPLADPTDCAGPAVSCAPSNSAEMSPFDWTRQPGAVTCEAALTMSSAAPAPELSTQSGISPSEAAVALAWSDQPPGGQQVAEEGRGGR